MSDETRVVDPDTGGEKGAKLERFDLIPVMPLEATARHYGIGARKYAERNWERGYAWSLSFAAMMRHSWAFWRGEDIDPETGSPHLAAVVFHAFTLMEFGRTHPEKDDRPIPKEAKRHPMFMPVMRRMGKCGPPPGVQDAWRPHRML